MSKKFYYAVRVGNQPGIYNTWDECKAQVDGFPKAKYKKFKTLEEAEVFIDGGEIKSKIMDSDEDIKNLKDTEAIAYVDGSFSLEEFMYSYGVVFITNKTKEDYYARGNDKVLAEMRNVSGELKGAMVAMEIAIEKNIEKLYLHYDYMGIEEWAMGTWKTNKDGTKKYKEYYDSIKDKLKVIFIKVPAHEGIKYNEEADRLAKKAFL